MCLLVLWSSSGYIMKIRQAEQILHNHSASFRRKVKGFSSVMVLKDAATKRLKLVVGVEKELPEHAELKKLKANATRIRDTASKLMEDELEVDVKVTGRFRALLARTEKWFPEPGAPGGVSISHKDLPGSGTLGTMVFSDCNKYILGNNHVLANQNLGEIGDSILQPGVGDGGEDPVDKIGELTDFVPILFWNGAGKTICNTIDAALCRLTEQSYVADGLLDADNETLYYPKGEGDWRLTFDDDREVKTSGKTSGVTTSWILGEGSCWVHYYPYDEYSWAWFTCQIITWAMLSAGDSGSILIDNVTKKVIGLGFAGSDIISVFNNICYVAQAFMTTFYPTRNHPLLIDSSNPLKQLLEEDATGRLLVGRGRCLDCPCKSGCPADGCEYPDGYTPRFITVALSGVELPDCCDTPDGACGGGYYSTLYEINVNKTYILEQDDANPCLWKLDLGALKGGYCYSQYSCLGNRKDLDWLTENAMAAERIMGQMRFTAWMGGHLVFDGYGDVTGGCTNCTISNNNQDEPRCSDPIFARGTATIHD